MDRDRADVIGAGFDSDVESIFANLDFGLFFILGNGCWQQSPTEMRTSTSRSHLNDSP